MTSTAIAAFRQVPFQGKVTQSRFSGTQQTHFGSEIPASNGSKQAGQTIGKVLRPFAEAVKGGLHEVQQNLGRTTLWTAGMFVLGFVPFLHLFLIPAVATFPLFATIDFLKGAWDSIKSEPALKSGFQSLAKTAKSTWESATKPTTPPASTGKTETSA